MKRTGFLFILALSLVLGLALTRPSQSQTWIWNLVATPTPSPLGTPSVFNPATPANWFTQKVCTDSSGNILAVDPYSATALNNVYCASGHARALLGTDTNVPYYHWSYNYTTCGNTQCNWYEYAVPLLTPGGTTYYALIKQLNPQPPSTPANWYVNQRYYPGQTQYDTYGIFNNIVSTVATRDTSGFDQIFWGNNGGASVQYNGWVTAPTSFFPSPAPTASAFYPISGQDWEQQGSVLPVPAYTPVPTGGDTQTVWYETPFLYDSGRTIQTLVSQHQSGPQVASTNPDNGHMEIWYYTIPYGPIRWEVWSAASCLANTCAAATPQYCTAITAQPRVYYYQGTAYNYWMTDCHDYSWERTADANATVPNIPSQLTNMVANPHFSNDAIGTANAATSWSIGSNLTALQSSSLLAADTAGARLAAVAYPTPPATGVIYVATTGNDATGTGAAAHPYATLQKAASVVSAGSYVSVAPGTYTGGSTAGCGASTYVVLMCTSGTSANPIQFVSQTQGGAIISGGSTSASTSTNYCVGFNTNISYVTIQGFTVQNCALMGIIVNAAVNTNISILQNTIQHIAEWKDTGCSVYGKDGIYIGTSASNILIDRNIIHDTGRLPGETPACTPAWLDYQTDHSVYLHGVQNLTFTNNVIYDAHSGWPIQISGCPATGTGNCGSGTDTGILIANNTILPGPSPNPQAVNYATGDVVAYYPEGTRDATYSGIYENNIDYAPAGYLWNLGTSYCGGTCPVTGGNWTFTNNIVGNNVSLTGNGTCTAPTTCANTGNQLNTNPKIGSATATAPVVTLLTGSPAIGSGVYNATISQYDFFGVPRTNPPSIGASDRTAGVRYLQSSCTATCSTASTISQSISTAGVTSPFSFGTDIRTETGTGAVQITLAQTSGGSVVGGTTVTYSGTASTTGDGNNCNTITSVIVCSSYIGGLYTQALNGATDHLLETVTLQTSGVNYDIDNMYLGPVHQ